MKRKTFNYCLSALATGIVLSSSAATYTIQKLSWSDWPPYAAMFFSLASTAAIEILFLIVLNGLEKVLAGSIEKFLGIVTISALLIVMAINFVVHRQIVMRVPLSIWQESYVQWSGAAILFIILALIVLFQLFSFDARERRMARDIAVLSKERALEWQRNLLESEEVTNMLNSSKDEILTRLRNNIHQ